MGEPEGVSDLVLQEVHRRDVTPVRVEIRRPDVGRPPTHSGGAGSGRLAALAGAPPAPVLVLGVLGIGDHHQAVDIARRALRRPVYARAVRLVGGDRYLAFRHELGNVGTMGERGEVRAYVLAQ
uniref:Unannotated protein n=1 Tax=freshwater metagenome TaxID=449393 RepID=A0A6J7MKD2_9ZZZZ